MQRLKERTAAKKNPTIKSKSKFSIPSGSIEAHFAVIDHFLKETDNPVAVKSLQEARTALQERIL